MMAACGRALWLYHPPQPVEQSSVTVVNVTVEKVTSVSHRLQAICAAADVTSSSSTLAVIKVIVSSNIYNKWSCTQLQHYSTTCDTRAILMHDSVQQMYVLMCLCTDCAPE
jgi:hypothetical protein